MSAEEHDRTYALVSHLPHWVAFALTHSLSVQVDAKQLWELSGTGLKDTTRIAGSNPQLWADISLENKQELLRAIAGFQASMKLLQDALENQDRDTLEAAMLQAKNWRGSN